MILFYTDELNPRIEYIVRLIFTDILKTDVSFTSSAVQFRSSSLPGINYSREKFKDEFYIRPHPLMYFKTLVQPDLKPVWYNGEKYFFKSSDKSDLPFDPLAASFYVVTRYEEYIDTERDKYNRYQAHSSILYKYGLLKKPVVNIWAEILAEKLKERYPELIFTKRKFEFLSTIDIDNAWAYSNKPFWRAAGAFAKTILKGNFPEFKKRLLVLRHKREDPFYTYPFTDKIFAGNEDKIIYFLLLGNYGKYDKNISWKNRKLRDLIVDISGKYAVGIHFSFFAGIHKSNERMLTETGRLEKITGEKIFRSRQHFLLLNFPDTYRNLVKSGIKEDYTMGYASATGFRAGICTPYYFYDLLKEEATDLKVFPFQVMDTTLQQYMGLSAGEARKEIELLMNEVKKAGGMFVSLWHNESLSEEGHWKGYSNIFREMNEKGFNWANE
jgi:hypothetical protein